MNVPLHSVGERFLVVRELSVMTASLARCGPALRGICCPPDKPHCSLGLAPDPHCLPRRFSHELTRRHLPVEVAGIYPSP
jgi:hypothetical protein